MSNQAPPTATHMARFLGHKTAEQIKAQCTQLGLKFYDQLYQDHKSDFVVIEGGGARAYYSDFNGTFFGTTDTGIEFDSRETAHEGEQWFQDLLDFFMVVRAEVKPS